MIIFAIITYLFFVSITAWYSRQNRCKLNTALILKKPYLLIKLYICGVFILGIPLVYYQLYHFSFLQAPKFQNLWQIALMGLSLVGVIALGLQTALKEARVISYTKDSKYRIEATLVGYFITIRVLFLIVYEFFFRGILLFSTIRHFGPSIGIILNILLYTLIHFPAPPRVIAACIPFGLILCVFTLWLQSVWPAVILHLLLAVMSEGIFLNQFLIESKKQKI